MTRILSGGGSLSRWVSAQGGLCLGVSIQEGLCPEGGLCLEGGLYPERGLSRGGLCLGGSLSSPRYGNERAVRILKECILVLRRCVEPRLLHKALLLTCMFARYIHS